MNKYTHIIHFYLGCFILFRFSVRQVTDVIRRHHLLLVTLLLANSIAMETLPIFLDRLVPSWIAVLLSVTAILLFGEVRTMNSITMILGRIIWMGLVRFVLKIIWIQICTQCGL